MVDGWFFEWFQMDPYQNLEGVQFNMVQHVLNYLYTKFQASTPMFLEFGDLSGSRVGFEWFWVVLSSLMTPNGFI